MFNLLMFNIDWQSGRADVPVNRVLEYTDEHVAEKFRSGSTLALDRLKSLPCIFCEEGTEDEPIHIGYINKIQRVSQELRLDIAFDERAPKLQNSFLYKNRRELNMPENFEFSRNHWAIKDVDLYQFLFHSSLIPPNKPKVFKICGHSDVGQSRISVMMPFSAEFNQVYRSIKDAAKYHDMQCNKANDIWEDDIIIQDIVSLIEMSHIIVCDCTGRNPNVFYEIGIAHTLGREVILMTQSRDDIPFDLRHIRFLHYHNNGEGLAKLKNDLQNRIGTILNK